MNQNSSVHQSTISKEQKAGLPGEARSFQELGALIRRHREEQGLSLAEISMVTKVKAHYLEALEMGQPEKLPSGIYRTGYLRSYLAALNEDPAPWTRRFRELSGPIIGGTRAP